MEVDNPTPFGGRGNRRRKGRGTTIRRDWNEKPGRKAFIGLYSPEERKKLFLEYFEKRDYGGKGSVRSTQTPVQSPYDPSSWYKTADLESITSHLPELREYNDVFWRFKSRYTRMIELGKHKSTTSPSLYTIDSVGDYFKHILYERGDLFMKVVPLGEEYEGRYYFLVDESLSEIYNEIIIGYFLNELVYGYTNVLSIHFMTIIDWFVAMKESLVSIKEGMAQPLHQIIITEKMDISVYDYLKTNYSLDIVRAIIFQVFHSLEIAWHTNQYTHNDLHTDNVMLRLSSKDSPLKDKDFVYRRLVDNRWYRIDRNHHKNMVVKIIDFGRNRMLIPINVDHIEDGNHRHHHPQVTCAKDMDSLGNPCDRANRHIDVKVFLLNILNVWNIAAVNEPEVDKKQLHDMCDRMIDFDRVNMLIRNYYYGKHVGDGNINPYVLEREWKSVGERVSAENYHLCKEAQKLLKIVGNYDKDGNLEEGVFIYRMDEEGEMGALPTDILNDPFFNSYKLETLVQDYAIPDEDIFSVKSNHVVVSFIAHPEEALMLDATTGAYTPRCSECNAPNPKHIAGEDFLCGKACYDFKYLFGSKTVYR